MTGITFTLFITFLPRPRQRWKTPPNDGLTFLRSRQVLVAIPPLAGGKDTEMEGARTNNRPFLLTPVEEGLVTFCLVFRGRC